MKQLLAFGVLAVISIATAQMLGEHSGPGCPHYMFDCLVDGDTPQCVEINQICDGHVNCRNAYDENNARCPNGAGVASEESSEELLGERTGPGCPHYMFDCHDDSDTPQCVEIHQICDGHVQCRSGRDENNERCPDGAAMSSEESSEEEVVRCNRELCDVLCPLGHVVDEEGCPTCDCLQDPCQAENACPPRHKCSVRHMDGQIVPECSVEMPCAMPMCASDCGEAGYRHTERGCMTCECNDAEPADVDHCQGYECPQNHLCLPLPDTVPNHMVSDLLDRMKAICVHDIHVDPFLNRFGVPTPAPTVPNPALLCHGQMQEELRGAHRIPLSHHIGQNCNPDGSFKPMQCDVYQQVCWCVDDAGTPIEGTRMRRQHPNCEEYHTVATKLWMVFDHDMGDEHMRESMDRLERTIIERVSAWTGIREALIDVQTMRPCGQKGEQLKIRPCGQNGEQLKVLVVLSSDGRSHLPNIIAQLQYNMQQGENFLIQHGEFTLTPVPTRFEVEHESYLRDLIIDEDYGSWDSSSEEWSGEESRCGRLWREHKAMAIVGGICGCVVALAITGLLIACCKRRWSAKAQFHHKKLDKYKENIAYNNEIMASHPDVAVEEKSGSDLYKVTVTDTNKY